jgi:hypothetical protein
MYYELSFRSEFLFSECFQNWHFSYIQNKGFKYYYVAKVLSSYPLWRLHSICNPTSYVVKILID